MTTWGMIALGLPLGLLACTRERPRTASACSPIAVTRTVTKAETANAPEPSAKGVELTSLEVRAAPRSTTSRSVSAGRAQSRLTS
ncbi:MAG: hypothetical protein FJ096_02670 [Deltaproteobacteria bacterium]|nr:hypothetical protein [Deltaproteobacteria bacterium]